MPSTDKILIVGWGRSGKDAAGAFLHEHCGIPYCASTSWAALPMIAETLDLPMQLAWESRHRDRQLWKDICDAHRIDDPLLLIRKALEFPGRVVTGIRDKCEMDAAMKHGLFAHVLWIHRDGIPEDRTVTFTPDYPGVIIVKNNGTLHEFHRTLYHLAMIRLGGVRCTTEYAQALEHEPFSGISVSATGVQVVESTEPASAKCIHFN